MRQGPAYCIHKTRNLAFIRLGGRMIYLGRAHSPESHERYHEVLAAHYAGKPIHRPATDKTARHGFCGSCLSTQALWPS